MIEVIAVLGPLRAADARECAVEAVAEPVHAQHQARDPEPGGVVAGQGVGRARARGGEHADGREVIGPDGARHAGGERLQRALLRAREQERHFPATAFGQLCHPSVFVSASTDSSGFSSIVFGSAGSCSVVSVVGPRTRTRTIASPWANLMSTGPDIAKSSGPFLCP